MVKYAAAHAFILRLDQNFYVVFCRRRRMV
jgi:hypothetical protein